MKELEAIVVRLERGELTLDDSIRQYERGEALKRHCAALLDRANRVLTRDMLLDLLRGRQAGPFDRAIDVAVSRLRRKLEDDGRRAQIIKTVRSGGYVLSAQVERG